MNTAGHGQVPWQGELLIGRDPWGTPRSFAGEIDDVRETRPEWDHYDLRFEINDKPVYVETRLNCRLPFVPSESTILVVNIHEP